TSKLSESAPPETATITTALSTGRSSRRHSVISFRSKSRIDLALGLAQAAALYHHRQPRDTYQLGALVCCLDRPDGHCPDLIDRFCFDGQCALADSAEMIAVDLDTDRRHLCQVLPGDDTDRGRRFG